MKDCNKNLLTALAKEMGKLAILDYENGILAKTPIDQIIKACQDFKRFLKPELIKKNNRGTIKHEKRRRT